LSETEVIVHCSYVNENVVMRLKLNLMKRVLGNLFLNIYISCRKIVQTST